MFDNVPHFSLPDDEQAPVRQQANALAAFAGCPEHAALYVIRYDRERYEVAVRRVAREGLKVMERWLVS